MYCTHCGTQLPSEARFCHRCGAPAQGSFPRRPAGGPAPKKLTRTEVLLLALVGAGAAWQLLGAFVAGCVLLTGVIIAIWGD